MALTANIQPVQVIDQTATQLSTYIINYDLTGTTCTTYWSISDESGSTVYNGNWNVPQDVLANWGTNDNVIIEALAEAKGFTIIDIVSGSL